MNIQKIYIILTVFWITGLIPFIFRLLSVNLGIPYNNQLVLIFLIIPLFNFVQELLKQKIIPPYFYPFLIFSIIFLFLESTWIREVETNNDLLYQIFLIYLYFNMLLYIWKSEKKVFFIVNIYIISVFIITSITIIGYLGFIVVSDYPIYSITKGIELSTRYGGGGIYHPNALSFAAMVGLFLIHFKRSVNKYNQKSIIDHKIINIIIYFILLLIIILNASRGVFIIYTLLISVHFYYYNKFFLSIIIILIFLLPLTYYITEQIALPEIKIIQRILEETSTEEARITQIIATMETFLDSPIIGKGWENAISTKYGDLVGANFLYSQILATGGLLLFSSFIVLWLRIFLFSSYRTQLFNKLCLTIIGLLSVFFYNPSLTASLSIIIFLIYRIKSTNENSFY